VSSRNPSLRVRVSPLRCFVAGRCLAVILTALLTVSVGACTGPPRTSPAPASSSWPAAATAAEEQLEAAVLARLATLSGDYAVAVRELTGEERSVSIRGGEAREPASVVKLFAAYAALDRVDSGQLAVDDVVRSGVTVGDCLRVLLVISDNNCHWELVDLLGEDELRQQFSGEGYPATTYPDGYGDDAANPLKTTSADDIVLLLQRLHDGELLSADSTALMVQHLSGQVYRQRIPSGVPADAVVVNKTGRLLTDDERGLVNTDAAIVSTSDGTYVIAIMGLGATTDWALASLARAVHEALYGPVVETAEFTDHALEVVRTTTRHDQAESPPAGTVAAGTRLAVLWSQRDWVYVTQRPLADVDGTDFVWERDAYWVRMDDLRSIYEPGAALGNE